MTRVCFLVLQFSMRSSESPFVTGIESFNRMSSQTAEIENLQYKRSLKSQFFIFSNSKIGPKFFELNIT